MEPIRTENFILLQPFNIWKVNDGTWPRKCSLFCMQWLKIVKDRTIFSLNVKKIVREFTYTDSHGVEYIKNILWIYDYSSCQALFNLRWFFRFSISILGLRFFLRFLSVRSCLSYFSSGFHLMLWHYFSFLKSFLWYFSF